MELKGNILVSGNADSTVKVSWLLLIKLQMYSINLHIYSINIVNYKLIYN